MLRGVGTIENPDPDRDRLNHSYDNTGGSPFNLEARREMMGRLAEGTGNSKMARIGRVVIRAAAWITLASIFLTLLVDILNQPA